MDAWRLALAVRLATLALGAVLASILSGCGEQESKAPTAPAEQASKSWLCHYVEKRPGEQDIDRGLEETVTLQGKTITVQSSDVVSIYDVVTNDQYAIVAAAGVGEEYVTGVWASMLTLVKVDGAYHVYTHASGGLFQHVGSCRPKPAGE